MVEIAVKTALDAGTAILEFYGREFDVEYKSDRSPLTVADKTSHDIITAALQQTAYPVLSEESAKIAYDERRRWRIFWLVDPLDGTKEFIKKNGEFTVNIALIDSGVPVLGVVHMPVEDTLYLGMGETAMKAVHCKGKSSKAVLESASICRVSGTPSRPLRVVASKSHCNDATRKFIADLEEIHGEVELVSRGSSLKLCMVAEGAADIYPRIAPTMEWDTAAAHAIVKAAGGEVFAFDADLQASAYTVTDVSPSDNLQPVPVALHYNKQNLLNPYFVVSGLHK